MIFKNIAKIKRAPGNPRNSEGDFIKLPDGRIMFAYSRYSGESWDDGASCSIYAVYSRDNGETFDVSSPVLLVSAERFGVKNIMSVTLRYLANGDIGLFFIVKHEDKICTSEYVLIRSADGCDFSGEAVRCLPDTFDGYYVINNSRVEIMPSGRIIIPAGCHRASFSEGKFIFEAYSQAMFFCSDDDGHSFRRAPELLNMPHPRFKSGLQEPGAVTIQNGVLYAYFRTDAGRQYQSYSADGGIHWTTPEPSRFTSPLSPMKIAKNPYSGKYYSVWNPIPNYDGRVCGKYGWGRTPLCIAESDDGISFGNAEYIETDAERGFCYPAIYFISDKKALISYCSGGVDCACLCETTITSAEL